MLLEGDVGVGKTTLLRAAARGLGGAYERVEGTIDLMPADMIYHTFIGEDGRPRVEPGPVIRYGSDLTVFFFNEINRARPQVHSLLLRLMAERSISAFNREYHFPYLLVFADRNRIEREETFELPAAARDRFLMEIGIATPAAADIRKALAFDPRFHDADKLIAAVPEASARSSRAARRRGRHPDTQSKPARISSATRSTCGRRFAIPRRPASTSPTSTCSAWSAVAPARAA